MRNTRLSFHGMVSDPFSFFNIFTIFLLMLIFTVVVGLPLVIWIVIRPSDFSFLNFTNEIIEIARSPRVVFLLLAFQNGILISLIYFRVIKVGRRRPEELGITTKNAPKLALYGLGWAALFMSVIALVTFILSLWDVEGEPPFGIPKDPLELVLVLIAGCLFAPVAEELFFRAYIITAVKKRYSTTFAYLFSAGFFAVAHASLAVIVPMVMMGLFLAFVFDRYNSIVPCIVIHATNNFFAIMALYLM